MANGATPQQVTQQLIESLKIIKEELKAWRAESKQNQEKLRALESKLASLTTSGTGGVAASQVEDLQKRVNQLMLKVDEISKRSDLTDQQLKEQTNKLAQTVMSLNQKMAEVGNIKDKIEMAKGATPAEIDAKLSSLRLMLQEIGDGLSQLSKLKMELDRLESENQRMASEVNELRERFEQMSIEGSSPGELEELRDRVDELAEKIGKTLPESAGPEFLQNLSKELQKWHEESTKNAEALGAVKEELAKLEEQINDTEKLKEHTTKIKKEIKELSREAERLRAINDVIQKHSEQIEQLYSFIGKEKVDIEEMEHSLKTLESKIAAWQEENKRRLQETKELEEKLKRLKSKEKLSSSEINEIKAKMDEFAIVIGKLSELGEMGPQFFKNMKKELDAWRRETKQNAAKLAKMKKQAIDLRKKLQRAMKLRDDVGKLREELTQSIADTLSRFQELKEAILRHGEEFESVYSLLGKEELEIEKMDSKMKGLRKTLKEWHRLNEESIEQSKLLQKKLEGLKKKVSGKKGLPVVIKELEDVSKDIERLKEEEKRLEVMESEIEGLRKRLEETRELRAQIRDLQDTLVTITENIKSFQGLRDAILKHAEQLKKISSLVSKEEIDVKQLNAKLEVSIRNFREKMKDLESMSNESIKRTKMLADRLDGLAKRVTGKDGIPTLSRELSDLADEIRKLEKDQLILKQKQKEMVKFDDEIESMVQKALRENITKKELEEQFNKLRRMKKKVVPPKELAEAKREALKLASRKRARDLKYLLDEFMKKLKKAPKERQAKIWNDYRNKFKKVIERVVEKEKKKLTKKGDSRKRLLLTKMEVLSLSLDNAFARKNMKKVTELTERLAELKARLKD